jgi:PAS domain S-box-containing protein
LIDRLPVIVYRRRSDDAWTLIEASGDAEQLLGRPLGGSLIDLIHPDDRDRVKRSAGRSERFCVEYRVVVGGERVLWVRDQGAARGTNNRLVEGLITDITSERTAKQELESSESRLKDILENTPVVLWSVDAGGVFRFVGGKGELEATSASNYLGHTIDELFKDQPIIAANHRRAFAGEAFSTIVEHRGQAYDAFYAPVRNESGEVIAVRGVALDITTRKRSEHSLRQSEEVRRKILEAVPAGIVQVDKEGAIREANEIAQDFLGLSYESLSERYVADWNGETIHEDGTPFPVSEYPVTVCLTTQQPNGPVTIGVRRPDGTLRWGVFRADPITDPTNGEFVAALVAFVDITDRKRAEEEKHKLELQLAQSQKLEAIGRLAGGVAHDFNNLLTSVLGHASLIRASRFTGTEEREAARTIEMAAERGAALTRQLLGFARQGNYQSVALDLNRVVQETIDLLSRTVDKRIEIAHGPTPGPAVITGDPGQIQQVVLNLALNARDAMPKGGRLDFSLSEVTIDQSYCRVQPDARPGRCWVLTVSDTGVGMPRDVRDRIFEPFFTTKPEGKGSGMGLAMSYGIVKSHGGWIVVDSVVGQGTMMHIYLPISAQRLTPDPPVRVDAGEKGTACILFADDEEAVRRAAARQLSSLGYRVHLAVDGNEALELYRSRPREFDLVMLDLTMPRLDGAGCFAELRRFDPNVRVVLSTGYGQTEVVQRCLSEGLNGFLEKPYRTDELGEAVRRALNASGSKDRGR